ncbi:GNAT family N-acetyltransferase [Sporolactobacillus shoreicorticis]|uniref:GNAT family N-acetyltransferase n=1 Tax=Sporolactobacillus shoreicorticis TaxID=1923877 RepID=A0ABW5S4H3_9BACL|nr:GNAT family protein [Sporolactobacillus shoreicorticis]MCO7127072.1 GNAT family N-acetyltransferase [Sporolactobacillus shoreicorticis]
MSIQLKEEFLKGALIRLVPTEEADLTFVKSVERAVENAQFVGDWTVAEHQAALTDHDKLHFTVRDGGNVRVGYIILAGVASSDHNINLLRIAVTQKGKGYGTEVLFLLKRLCFEGLGAHRLWLDVVDDNGRARHVYQKAGFVQEGVLRECMRYSDRYKSLIVMSLLEHEYSEK